MDLARITGSSAHLLLHAILSCLSVVGMEVVWDTLWNVAHLSNAAVHKTLHALEVLALQALAFVQQELHVQTINLFSVLMEVVKLPKPTV